VYAYFAEIGRNAPIDVTLYNIPMFASPIDVPTVARLAELPRIIGMKDSSGDIAHMQRMIAAVRKHRPEFCFLCGWDPALLPHLLIGCNGGTNALAGIAPKLMMQLYRQATTGEITAAQATQTLVTGIFDAVLNGVDFPDGVRAAVKLLGFDLGDGRMPLGDSYRQTLDAASQRIAAALQAADSLK